MTAFAIFYNDEDLATIQGSIQRSDLTNPEKQTAQKLWNAGLKNWAVAPMGLSPCSDPVVAWDSRRVVIDGPGLTVQTVVDLLNSIASHIGLPQPGGYLTSLALDVAQCSVEPWPPV
jgi:hypothetical protein